MQLGNFMHSIPDKSLCIAIEHNLASCYQKIGALDKSVEHITEALEIAMGYYTYSTNTNIRIKNMRYICKTHLQLCALLSQQSRHEEAISHSFISAKLSHMILDEVLAITEEYKSRIEKTKLAHHRNISVNEDGEDGNVGIFLLQQCAYKLNPILRELSNRVVQDNMTVRKKYAYKNVKSIDSKSIIGWLGNSDWSSNLNIGNIMQILPLSLFEIESVCGKHLDVTRESIIDKICLVISSYFCISTEKRFLALASNSKEAMMKESESWHAKSLELCCAFLPTDCPLVSHIIMSYQKHHAVTKQIIV
jgi:hypothetical protein